MTSHGRPIESVAELRRLCAEARAQGLEAFPPCDHTDAKGRCLGHESTDGTCLSVSLGPEVFRFVSMQEWIDIAQGWFSAAGLAGRHDQCICIDAKGRVCTAGRHFGRANRDHSYPIIVYRIDEE